MKNKVIMIAGILVASAMVFVAAANSGGHKGVLLDSGAFRSAADIAGDTVFWLDSEALALSDSSDSDSGLRAEALEAFNLVNQRRADAGLNALEWDNNLEQVAEVRAEESSRKFDHSRPDGRAWNTVNSKIQGGENLAYGFDNAEDTVQAWWDSPTHKDNILYGDFQRGAIATFRDDNGVCYTTQQFGY